MSIIKGKGQDAKALAEQEKANTLRLKDGESVKVRLLSSSDYVAYQSAGDFEAGIFEQPVADDSPILVAHEKGGDEFKNLYPKTRYLFAFADITSGKLVAFDASRNQAKGLISTIEEYEDDLDDIAFNFKRTGEKLETKYNLNPIIKLKGDDKKNFEDAGAIELEDKFYEDNLQPRPEKTVIKYLVEIDENVIELFPKYTLDDFADDEESEKVDNSGDTDDLDIV